MGWSRVSDVEMGRASASYLLYTFGCFVESSINFMLYNVMFTDNNLGPSMPLTCNSICLFFSA